MVVRYFCLWPDPVFTSVFSSGLFDSALLAHCILLPACCSGTFPDHSILTLAWLWLCSWFLILYLCHAVVPNFCPPDHVSEILPVASCPATQSSSPHLLPVKSSCPVIPYHQTQGNGTRDAREVLFNLVYVTSLCSCKMLFYYIALSYSWCNTEMMSRHALDAMWPGTVSCHLPLMHRDKLAEAMHGHRGIDQVWHYKCQSQHVSPSLQGKASKQHRKYITTVIPS